MFEGTGQMEFNKKWEKFLGEELTPEEAKSYFKLDKSAELSYMKDYKYRFKTFLVSIPHSQKPLRILDIGTTPFTFFIKKLYPHYEVATLDLTRLMEERCKVRNIQFKTCDLAKQSIPFEDNYFDIVIFTDVLEHLFALPLKVLKEIWRVLRGREHLLFSTPNFATLSNRIALLRGKNPLMPVDIQMRQGHVHGYGHIREYTMQECVSILESCNFTIVRRRFISPAPHRQVVPPFRPTIYIEATANKVR